MADWMRQNRFDSPYLDWYVNYACRDDYGALASSVSAWAGIHYFASRENEDKGPFTWPEGNGWIAKRLLAKLGRYVHTGAAVYRILRDGRRFRVLTEDTEYVADAVIFAAPTFLASYLMEGAPTADGFEYSPWLTANLTLDRIPRERGIEMAWDNVIYDSPGARLRGGDASESEFARRSDGVDLLLGAGAGHAGGESEAAAREGLGVLERGDPERSGSGASGYSRVRFADRYHADGACDGAAGGGISGVGASEGAGGLSGGEFVVREFGFEWDFDF